MQDEVCTALRNITKSASAPAPAGDSEQPVQGFWVGLGKQVVQTLSAPRSESGIVYSPPASVNPHVGAAAACPHTLAAAYVDWQGRECRSVPVTGTTIKAFER